MTVIMSVVSCDGMGGKAGGPALITHYSSSYMINPAKPICPLHFVLYAQPTREKPSFV